MSLVNDIMLVTRVRMLHDNKAFDSLVVKYQQSIRRFFLNQTLGNEALSDDLAQDTFIKAYTCLHQFQAHIPALLWHLLCLVQIHHYSFFQGSK